MKKQKTVTAYHFVGKKLRDGKPIPKNGTWLKHKGAVVMCESGFHASRHPFDALQYAPGVTLCKVHVRRNLIEGEDKLVGRERLIVARIDATDVLRRFARKCALDCIKNWDAPEIVVRWLKTGDESIRSAARSAAELAASAAARSAAWSAAELAARSAARSAAWSAEWSAASAAAWSAARSAASAAAWSAEWSAAELAAWSAARKRFAGMVRQEFAKQSRKGRKK